jgi:hypothetical protein
VNDRKVESPETIVDATWLDGDGTPPARGQEAYFRVIRER